MFKYFACALLASIASAQAPTTEVTADAASPCAVCWDGSLGVLEGDLCACPPIPVEEPEVADEPESNDENQANPNCTTGNR